MNSAILPSINRSTSLLGEQAYRFSISICSLLSASWCCIAPAAAERGRGGRGLTMCVSSTSNVSGSQLSRVR